MPFITEEIWSFLDKPNKLINDRWPETDTAALEQSCRAAYDRVETVKDIVRAVRNIRADVGADPKRKLGLVAVTENKDRADALASLKGLVTDLAGLTDLHTMEAADGSLGDCATAVTAGFTLYVPMADLIDYAAERDKLEKELVRLEKVIAAQNGKLSNEKFTSKAPEKVVQTERDKLKHAQADHAKTKARLEELADKAN
jgi:valyl-tRNA synthetase